MTRDEDRPINELTEELRIQRSKIGELEKIKNRLEELEEEKDSLVDNLKERVKELNCLYDISKANEMPNTPLEELFQKIVEKIPIGWKYPEIACARIKLDGQEFKTMNFSETNWKLDAPINYYNKNIGKLEIFYLEERPELEEGPFLMAERKLILAIVEKLGHIIERKYSEQALRESEEKFRTLFNNASDAIFIHELDGNFIETNHIASDLLGYNKTELLNMAPKDIHPPEYVEMLNDMFEELKKINYYCFETDIVAKDGHPISVEICSKIIKLKKRNVVLSIVRDITERKITEEKMKRQLMKFNLEAGKVYLVKETKSLFSIEAFNDLLKVGYSGYILTRSLESEYSKQIKGKYNYLWISEKDKRSSISPDFTEIENYLEGIPRKSFVLIDRIDYLVYKNGFTKFLSFVHHLREIAYLRGITIIISADPEVFSSIEIKLIEKETTSISPIDKEKLPENMLEIIRFVYNKNLIGVKPTFSDIGREINITRPTMGKRISYLTSSNYISVSIKGRNKIVELTNKGRELLSP